MVKVKKIANVTVMGVRRMAVTIFCVIAITSIDIVHTVLMEPMELGSYMVIGYIAAMGGVDIIKSGFFKK